MKRLLAVFLLGLYLSGTAIAQELPKELLRSEALLEYDLQQESEGGGLQNFIKQVKEKGATVFGKQMKNALNSGIRILVICGVGAIAVSFAKAGSLPMSERVVELACICLLILSVYSDTRSILAESRQAVEEIGVFSKVLMPGFTTWAAAAGKPLSAVAVAGGAMVYTNTVCTIGVNWFFPMVLFYIFVAMAGYIGSNSVTQGIGTMLKSAMFWLIKLSLGGITLYLTISGAISAGGDGVTVKTAKAIAGVVPVVGSAIGSAAEGVLAGAASMRNVVGAIGIVGILSVVLMPFIRLAVYMVVFRCIAFVSSSITSSGMSKCIEAIAAGYSMAMGLLAVASGGVIMALTLSISVFGGL